MSRFDEKVKKYCEAARCLDPAPDPRLVARIARELGPAIFLVDQERVACSDPAEIGKIRETYLKEALGVEGEAEELDALIRDLCARMASRGCENYRVLLYLLLYRSVMEKRLSGKIES